jgi:ELWxxDGT repeat protein
LEEAMPQLALFEGINSNGQYGLWATDGTSANALELTGIAGASANGLSPTDMTVFNSEVLFNGVNASGQNGLWVTDGTAVGTHELTGITGVSANGLAPSDLMVFNGEVLFNGADASGQNGLWVTDGTAAGTHELTGITGVSANGLSPSKMMVFNGEVLFNGVDATGQYGPWETDGTAAGTHELSGIRTVNSNGVSPLDIITFIPAQPTTSVQQEILGLYAALYGRTAEFPGYSYWVGIDGQQSDSGGVTLSNAINTAVTLNDAQVLGQGFVNTQSTYFNQVYASLTDSQFINALYVNIGGNAGDPGGITYWTNLLQQAEAGGQSPQAARAGLVGQFVHDLVDYNLSTAIGLTPTQLLAAEQRQSTIDNKIAVSLAYAEACQLPGGTLLDPQTIGDAAYQAATMILQSITFDPATVTTAITGISNAVAHQDLLLI